MFDFLKQSLAAAASFGADVPAQPQNLAKKSPPPPKAAAPAEQPLGEAQPDAFSDVFSGMIDGGAEEESYGVVAGQKKVPEPPKAHSYGRPSVYDPLKPTYRHQDTENNYSKGADESDEDFRKRLKSASKNFGDSVNYLDQDGYDAERELSRHQRAWWNGFTSEDREVKLSDKKLAALKIGLNEGNMPLQHQTRVEDLESPAGRMEALNILSQNMDPNHPNYKVTSEVSCAGASIVGGVLLAQGREGLKKLCNAVQAPDPEHEKPEAKALREKLNSGQELNIGDLQTLQQMVYCKLKESDGMTEEQMAEQVKIATESKDDKARAEAKQKLMVGNGGIDKFMKGNADIAKMFSDNNLDLAAIDTDMDTANHGDGSANHMVLRINGPDGEPIAYYDPWKKKGDQGQIINAQDGNIERNSKQVPAAVLEDYKKAERVRGHYDQSKGAREYTEKLLDKHGRPDDQVWWTDEQEKQVRRMEGQG